jgi:hypothetical protein
VYSVAAVLTAGLIAASGASAAPCAEQVYVTGLAPNGTESGLSPCTVCTPNVRL